MTREQWETFRSLATNPSLPTSESFNAWLWNGNGSNAASDGLSLDRDLRFIAFVTRNHIYGREERSAGESWELVRRAVSMIHSQNLRARLVKLTQQVAAEFADLVEREGVDTEELADPEVIFHDIARECLFTELERLSDGIRRPEMT